MIYADLYSLCFAPDTKFMKTNAKSESSGINHKAQTILGLSVTKCVKSIHEFFRKVYDFDYECR